MLVTAEKFRQSRAELMQKRPAWLRVEGVDFAEKFYFDNYDDCKQAESVIQYCLAAVRNAQNRKNCFARNADKP